MALLVNLSSGHTLAFDLEHQEAVAEWNILRRTRMNDITGLAIQFGGVTHTIPLKKTNFHRVTAEADVVRKSDAGKVVGEQIRLYADEIMVRLLVYRNGSPPMVRYEVQRTGRRVHLPEDQA